jgi:small subunit ribosomal protein S8e
MVNWQNPPKRKPSGGKQKAPRNKRKREMGRLPVETVQGEHRIKFQRVRGGTIKNKLYSDEFVNVSMGDTSKHVKIQDVIHNPSNKDYDRRKIITKNTIVKTELGRVKITSRPGQSATINGIIVEE